MVSLYIRILLRPVSAKRLASFEEGIFCQGYHFGGGSYNPSFFSPENSRAFLKNLQVLNLFTAILLFHLLEGYEMIQIHLVKYGFPGVAVGSDPEDISW